MSFRQLIYGNWAKGEGLELGRYGFGFQSVSDDVDRQDQDFVQSRLLYQTPTQWATASTDMRSPEEYPKSLVYSVSDVGVHGLAAGVYKGAGYDGRQGAHVTHAVITDEAKDFGQIRPAQYFGASWWRTEAADSKVLPPLEPPLTWLPDFDLEGLMEFVAEQDKGLELLVQLLSICEELLNGETRLLLVGDSARTVSRWVAAATCLLPMPQALLLTFRVFATSISSVPELIVAVHDPSTPDLAQRGVRAGFTVINVDRAEFPDKPPSERARWWVDRLPDVDPYDLQEAIDLADWLGGDSDERARTTSLLIATDSPILTVAEADAAIWSLGHMASEAFVDYGQDLIDLLKAAGRTGLVDTTSLLAQCTATAQQGATAEAEDMRRAVLGSIRDRSSGRRLLAAAQGQQFGEWQDEQGRQAALETALDTLASVDGETGAFLVGIATLFHVPSPKGDFAGARGVGEYLARTPADWPRTAPFWGSEAITGHTAESIELALQQDDRSTLNALARGSWNWLWPYLEDKVRDFPLTSLQVAAALAPGSNPAERVERIRLVAPMVSPQSWRDLWAQHQPEAREMSEWLAINSWVVEDRDFINLAQRVMRSGGGTLDRQALTLAQSLEAQRAPIDADLASAGASNRTLDTLLREARCQPADRLQPALARDIARAATPAILPARGADLCGQLIVLGNPSFAYDVLHGVGDSLTPDMSPALASAFAQTPGECVLLVSILLQEKNRPLDSKEYVKLAGEWFSKQNEATIAFAETQPIVRHWHEFWDYMVDRFRPSGLRGAVESMGWRRKGKRDG
jgi:hypothetical protein